MMRMPKLKEGDLVSYVWEDACTTSRMCRAEEYDPSCVVHSVGVFIKRSRGFFVTAVQHDDFDIGERDYRHWYSVPIKNLKKVTKLRGGR